MIHRIILDMDDVLNSLSFHILRHYGCDVGPFEYDRFPTHVGYDIITACEVLGGTVPYMTNPDWDGKNKDNKYIHDLAAFWNGVTNANLWRTIPKSPQCDWLIEEAAALVGVENVHIATTPTKDPQVHADKIHWIWDNLPHWIHRQYSITPRKWLLGKPGVILFDDHLENCQNFIDEGGEALLVPRPWNPMHWKDTDFAITHRLDEIESERIHV